MYSSAAFCMCVGVCLVVVTFRGITGTSDRSSITIGGPFIGTVGMFSTRTSGNFFFKVSSKALHFSSETSSNYILRNFLVYGKLSLITPSLNKSFQPSSISSVMYGVTIALIGVSLTINKAIPLTVSSLSSAARSLWLGAGLTRIFSRRATLSARTVAVAPVSGSASSQNWRCPCLTETFSEWKNVNLLLNSG